MIDLGVRCISGSRMMLCLFSDEEKMEMSMVLRMGIESQGYD